MDAQAPPYYVPEHDDDGNVIRKNPDRVHPLRMYGENAFRKRYRLPKQVCLDLVRDFIEWNPKEYVGNGGAIWFEDRFCLALRYLATGANYSPISASQHTSKSAVTRCLEDVLDYFNDNVQKYIIFPENRWELLNTAAEWEQFHGMPRCIGAMDGTHIALKKPSEVDEAPFVNRKGYHSINAMVLCDADKKFIHVSPGYPGCSGDAYVYNVSQLRQISDDGLLGDYYFLADSGYRQTRNVYIPIDHPADPAEVGYNVWHRSSRSIIERAIGLWKQRWRCLDSSAGYLYHEPEKVSRIIVTTACLHNICVAARVPLVEEDPDLPDAYRPIMMPLPQPRQRRQEIENANARADFIDAMFRNY